MPSFAMLGIPVNRVSAATGSPMAIGAYTLSFVSLGRLWLTRHRIFAVVARVDRSVLVAMAVRFSRPGRAPREPT
jgi:uncharacterized membrane protein